MNNNVEVLKIGLKDMLNEPTVMYSYWFITGRCNYNCDYCDIYGNEVVDWEVKQKIIEFLNYMDTIRKHKVLLYGGEPTIDPDFLKVVSELKSYIRLFTNLSQDLSFLKELIDIRNDMTISISYHLSKVNKKEFLDKLGVLISSNVKKIRVKIMADSRRKEESIREYEFFKHFESARDGYECYIDLVMPNSEGDIGAKWVAEDLDWFLPLQGYKELRLTYLDKNGEIKEKDVSWNEMRTTMIETNHYYKCGAGGKNLLYIDSNSDVFPCKSHTTPIFNLAKDDFYDYLDHFKDGMICDFMGFCCETEFPKKLVLRRINNGSDQNIRSRLISSNK